MCGIAGIVNRSDGRTPPSLELLRSMAATIRHRGPDEFGAFRDDYAGLVSTRLSIVDLATGQQPLSNEEGTLWIVFNGEIFNFIELQKELTTRGHRFRTRADTEVIVHAYEEWGEECFNRFNGQWAIALWDARARRLVLSRDRVGVRPLYVREQTGTVWFGSEVKAIFADQQVSRSFNPVGLAQTFTYWAPVAPTTVFEGIEEIPPGCVWIYEEDSPKREHRYWSLSYPVARDGGSQLSLHEATEALREKLMKATRLRMLRADVPVGSYLSGGLDSSIIAWMGRQAKEGDFRTFSIRFEDAEFDETEYQRLMASGIQSRHVERVVRRSDIAEVFPAVIRHTERPVLRTAPAPLFLLSEIVRDAGIKAVLTGEGADEMLAGYDIFREAKVRSFWAGQPDSTIRPLLFERLYPYLARSPQQSRTLALQFWRQGLDRVGQPGFSHEPRWSTARMLQKFFTPELGEAIRTSPPPDVLHSLPPEFSRWDELAQSQYLEIATLFAPYIISSQGDRMLMANSVEGRFPFLDAEVMEFCNMLPSIMKLPGLNEKNILKRMACGMIPEPIIRRKKQPYRSPDALCFVTADAPEYVSELLSQDALDRAGVFDAGRVRRLYGKCIRQAQGGATERVFSNTDNMSFVGVLSTQLLYHQFVRNNTAGAETVEFKTLVDRVGLLTNSAT